MSRRSDPRLAKVEKDEFGRDLPTERRQTGGWGGSSYEPRRRSRSRSKSRSRSPDRRGRRSTGSRRSRSSSRSRSASPRRRDDRIEVTAPSDLLAYFEKDLDRFRDRRGVSQRRVELNTIHNFQRFLDEQKEGSNKRPYEEDLTRRSGNNYQNRRGGFDRNQGAKRFRTDDRGGYRRGGFGQEPTPLPPPEVEELGLTERTELFRIRVSTKLEPFDLNHADLNNVPVADPERMRCAGYLPTETVDELWNQKSKLDVVFDSGKSDIYYQKRDYYFPLDRSGSVQFRNRAGDKLWQVHGVANILEGITAPTKFIDVCGGPGAFSQLLLSKAPQPCYGFGMTLEDETTPPSERWYYDLRSHQRYSICRGADDSGNVYKPENLDFMARIISFDQGGIQIAVSDGGFEIKKNEKGEHAENFQELYSGRIILSELLMALKVLEERGHFVCKLFDALSHFTQSLIFLTAQIFEECYVVKPLRSRIINSERYLVGKFLRKDAKLEFVVKLLTHLHATCGDKTTPLSAVPLDLLRADTEFLENTRTMCTKIAKNQIGALDLVMTAVEREIRGDTADDKANSDSEDKEEKKASGGDNAMDLDEDRNTEKRGEAVIEMTDA